MYDEIKILDIEKKTNSFQVVFEVPGRHYNQDYPKRLTHSFPLEPHLLEQNEHGDFEFEKTLRRNYLKTRGDDEKETEAKKRVKDAREKVKGKRMKKESQDARGQQS